MMAEVENIIKQTENMMRGGMSHELPALLKDSYDVFNWYSSHYGNKISSAIHDVNCSHNLSIAVKLHNKARSLSTTSLMELRAVLKAISAWMLSIYGEKNPKVHCIVIRLLSKAGQELNQCYNNPDSAIKCCSAAIQLWTSVCGPELCKSLPPVELQDIKISMFWTFLEEASLWDVLTKNHDAVRKSVSGAMTIMQGLPKQLKYSFAEQVSKLGHHAVTSSKTLQDSIHYFKMALNAIESTLLGVNDELEVSEESSSESSKTLHEVMEIRLKAQLALSFAYNETNQCDKAMSCIRAIESASSSAQYGAAELAERMAHTIAYAKHKIALKDRDFEVCEITLRTLLKLPLTPFDTALNAVKRFAEEMATYTANTSEGVQHNPTPHTEFFKILAGKYPRDPEYTVIRINHIQSTLAAVRTDTDAESVTANSRALEMVNSLVNDHLSGQRPLSNENHSEVKKIVTNRLRWHRAMGQWECVNSWCDAMLTLLSESSADSEQSVNISLVKVDALVKLCRYEEALKLAQVAVSRKKSTTTIVALFRAVLHARKPTSIAVKTLLDLQKQGIAPNNQMVSCLEELSRFTLCCAAVQECTAVQLTVRDKDETVTQLLREWLHHFAATRAWRQVRVTASQSMLGEEGEEIEDSYLAIMSNMTHLYLTTRLSRSIFASANTTEKRHKQQLKNVAKRFRSTSTETIPESADNTALRDTQTCKSRHDRENIQTPATKDALHAVDPATESVRVGAVEQMDPEDDLPDRKSTPEESGPMVHPGSPRSSNDSVIGELVEDPRIYAVPRIHPQTDSAGGHMDGSVDDILQRSFGCFVDDSAEMLAMPHDSQEEVSTQPQVMEVTTSQPAHCTPIEEEDDDEHADCASIQEYVDEQQDQQPDFFSVYGYPDCLVSAPATTGGPPCTMYIFRTTMQDFDNQLLRPLSSLSEVLDAVQGEGCELSTLGPAEELEYLTDLAWNLGTLLYKPDFCSFAESDLSVSDHSRSLFSVVEETDPVKVHQRLVVQQKADKLFLAARLFELAHKLYRAASRFESDDEDSTTLMQCRSLVTALAARLDGEAAFQSAQLSTGQYQRSDETSVCSANLLQAKADAELAQNLIRAQSDFEDNEWRNLRKSTLILEFALTTKVCDIQQCSEYVVAHSQDFLALSAEDLVVCAQRAKTERGGSVEITRSVLALALQVSSRDVVPNYAFMGSVLRQLVELSPSRQAALERVEEFEQMAFNMAQQPSAVVRFDQQDVDAIVSLAYNFGVTLLELDQVSLAEKFLAKAIAVLPYGSAYINGWLPKMQDTYAVVLKSKVDNASKHSLLELDASCSVISSATVQTGVVAGKGRVAQGVVNVVARDGPLSLDMMK